MLRYVTSQYVITMFLNAAARNGRILKDKIITKRKKIKTAVRSNKLGHETSDDFQIVYLGEERRGQARQLHRRVAERQAR